MNLSSLVGSIARAGDTKETGSRCRLAFPAGNTSWPPCSLQAELLSHLHELPLSPLVRGNSVKVVLNSTHGMPHAH